MKSQGIQVLSNYKINVNTSKRDICNISCTYKLEINNKVHYKRWKGYKLPKTNLNNNVLGNNVYVLLL